MADWRELEAELQLWRGGPPASFWWRDDDAVEPTPELERLLRAAEGIPLALAVIPGLATPALAERLRGMETVSVLQHGWRHESLLAEAVNEYPANRCAEDVSRELADGRRRLQSLFGAQALPVFSPPWHGFDDAYLPLLVASGVRAISRKGPRAARFAAPGLLQVNAHVAPILWSTSPPSFRDDDTYLEQLLEHLRGRRLGRHDAGEPTGLLTHHLAQDARSYGFIERLAGLVRDHPAAAWLDPRTVFA